VIPTGERVPADRGWQCLHALNELPEGFPLGLLGLAVPPPRRRGSGLLSQGQDETLQQQDLLVVWEGLERLLDGGESFWGHASATV
jgi:hypothetical protein